MSTIFISHSSRDNQAAKELEKRLAEQHHASVFLDLDPEKGIVAGQSWERTLYRKLRACRAVIALCTDDYLRSHWCFAEIALARMEGKHIFALQVGALRSDTLMPSILTERQFIDLQHNKEEGYRRLWRGLKEVELLGIDGDWDPKRPPYLGLDAYKEEHAPIFFGREDETQTALEMLDRGAPGLIMALGASGSGKSSLVRAGMLPRLRRAPERWLLVDPFRPGRDPFAELANALLLTYRRYAPDHTVRLGNAKDLRDRLEAGAAELVRHQTRPAISPDEREAASPSIDDERLQRLMSQLEELSQQPPTRASRPLLDFLSWSMEDLRRLCAQPLPLDTVSELDLDATPLVTLADHLRRDAEHREARVLLVIDQFEEMLGHDDPGGLFHRFLTLLRASVEMENSPLKILGTMRSDFLGGFQRHPALRGIDFESLSLGPMKTNGMRRVIDEPAKLGMIELETGLADRLLEDTETPDALPLLSFTLWVLWRDCHVNGRLSIRDYETLGGLDGAVATEAQAVLDVAQQASTANDLQRALIRMARPTESGGYARQPVRWDAQELRPVHHILEHLVTRRLLVSRHEGEHRFVEVAHEALFRSWQPLRTWLDNHRSELLFRQQLEQDAAAWEANQRAVDNLWRGGRLQQAQELMRQGKDDRASPDTSTIMAFVRTGVRRRNRQRWMIGIVALCVFAVLTGSALVANKQMQVAETHLRVAETQRQEAMDQTAKVKNALTDTMDIVAEEVASEFESQLARLQKLLKAIRDQVDDLAINFEYAGSDGIGETGSLTDIEDIHKIFEFGLTLDPAIKGFRLFPSLGTSTIYDQTFDEPLSNATITIDHLIESLTEDAYELDREEAIAMGRLVFKPELDDWLITISLDLPSPSKKTSLVALISLKQLHEYVKTHQYNEKEKSLWMVDAKGNVLLSTVPGHPDDSQVIHDALAYMSGSQKQETRPYTLPDGNRRLRTFKTIKHQAWVIILDREFL